MNPNTSSRRHLPWMTLALAVLALANGLAWAGDSRQGTKIYTSAYGAPVQRNIGGNYVASPIPGSLLSGVQLKVYDVIRPAGYPVHGNRIADTLDKSNIQVTMNNYGIATVDISYAMWQNREIILGNADLGIYSDVIKWSGAYDISAIMVRGPIRVRVMSGTEPLAGVPVSLRATGAVVPPNFIAEIKLTKEDGTVEWLDMPTTENGLYLSASAFAGYTYVAEVQNTADRTLASGSITVRPMEGWPNGLTLNVTAAPISGVLTNSKGVPLVGHPVEIREGSESGSKVDSAEETATMVTDVQGRYFSKKLPTGKNYFVLPVRDRGFGLIYNFTPWPVAKPAGQSGVNYGAVDGPVAGQVISGQNARNTGKGSPVAGVRFTLSQGSTVLQSVDTGADGNMLMTRVGAGPFTLVPSKANVDFDPASWETTLGQFGLVFNALFKISGKVTNARGAAVPNARILVYTNFNGGAPGLAAEAVTSAFGTYSITNLTDHGRQYRVQAVAENLTFTATRSAEFILGGNSVIDMDFTSSAQVAGRVTRDGTNGVPGILISGTYPGLAQPLTGTTAVDGRFVLAGVPNGEYVTVTPSSSLYRFDQPSRTGLAGTTNLDFTAAGHIKGRVVFSDGSGVAGITISARREDVLLPELQTVVTDGQGNYSFVTLANGRWTITPSTEDGFAYDQGSRTLTTGQEGIDFKVTQSPPTISPINDQYLGQRSTSPALGFVVSDREQSILSVRAESTDPLIVHPTNGIVVLSVTPTNWTVQITTGAKAGTTRVRLRVTDGVGGSAATEFLVNVDVRPEYRLLDLPEVAGAADSTAMDINDSGLVTGWASLGGAAAAWLHTPYGVNGVTEIRGQTVLLKDNGANIASLPQSLNNSGVVAGYDWIWRDGQVVRFGDLGVTLCAGGCMFIRDINDSNQLVAYSLWGCCPTNYVVSLSPTNIGQVLASRSMVGVVPRPYRINNRGQVLAFDDLTSPSLGRLFTTTATPGDPLVPVGSRTDLSRTAYPTLALNDLGQIAGQLASGRAYLTDTNGTNVVEIGLGISGESAARGLNNRVEVVGWANNAQGRRAFLYRGGVAFDLNEAISASEAAVWQLTEAAAINEKGEIAGIALRDGRSRAFRAVPAVVAGRSVPAPAEAYPRAPQWTILERPPGLGDVPDSGYFYWSEADQRLFALAGDITARISWPTNSDLTDAGRVSSVVHTVWPRVPQRHVVGAPVEVEPPALPAFPYRYYAVPFTTAGGVVDPGTRTFNASFAGWSVIQYHQADGASLNPQRQRVYFEVVQSGAWDDPVFGRVNRAWEIGKTITPSNTLSRTLFSPAGPGNDLEIVSRNLGAQFDNLQVKFESAPGLAGRVVASNGNQTLSVRINPAAANVTVAEVRNAINALPDLPYVARLANLEDGTGNFNDGGPYLRFNGNNTYVFTPDLARWYAGSSPPGVSPVFDYYQSIGIDFAADNQVPMTIECWFKPEAPGTIMSEQGSDFPNAGWRASVMEVQASGLVQVRVWNLPALAVGTARFNEWNHVALRYHPPSVEGGFLYEDGYLSGVLNGVPSPNTVYGTREVPWNFSPTTPLRYGIGMGTDQNLGAGGYFKGQIRDVRFWAYYRPDSDVAGGMNSILTGREAGLVAWYPLNEGAGSVGTDRSLGNILTIGGQTFGALGPGGPATMGGAIDWQVFAFPAAQVTSGGNVEHNDYPGRNGFVLFTNAFYDGVGADRAHDRSSRRGPIIPVNKTTTKTTRTVGPMVVAWYHRNAIGVSWPDRPVQYLPEWPANADKIVIAGLKDAPLAGSAVYPSGRIYNQPDINLPGFNPNEEHAFVIDGRIAALRNDLNSFLDLSEPNVLMKYRDPFTQEWRMKVFQVLAEDATHTFRYDWTAGLEIQPPYPLNLLPLCAENQAASGPIFKDYKGKLYAYSAGPGLSETNASIRYWYRLQSGFYYDLDGNGQDDRVVGDCVAWLDRRGENKLSSPNHIQGAPDVPINVTYRIQWPAEIPAFTIGDTLLSARNGLPDIYNQAAASVIFEGVNPDLYGAANNGASPFDSAVRLYDPITERSVSLPAGYLPVPLTDLQQEGQRQLFTRLPYHIKVRLLFDSAQRTLSFRGFEVSRKQPAGSPLLLPNVMNDQERTNILGLAAGDQVWEKAVNDLYDLTRNPNRLSLDGFTVSKRLLVGLHGTRTNASGMQLGGPVPDTLGGGPKALTAALPMSDAAAARLNSATPGLTFDGINDHVAVNHNVLPTSGNLTIEAWVYADPLGAGAYREFLSQGRFYLGFDPSGVIRAGDSWGNTGMRVPFGTWFHLAFVKSATGYALYSNGVQVATSLSVVSPPDFGSFYLGQQFSGGEYWKGQLDEVRVWNTARSAAQIQAGLNKPLAGNEPGLVAYWSMDDSSNPPQVPDVTGNGHTGTAVNGPAWTNGAPGVLRANNGYVTLAFNNDPLLGGLPVSLTIIRLDCLSGVYQGDIRVLPSDNIFDERLTLRHSADFGLEPQNFDFEWYYRPSGDDYPILDGNGVRNPEWQLYRAGRGLNAITLGSGAESGLLTITDNRWIVRYRGYTNACGPNWGNFAGAPGIVPTVAQLAEGWIKRVTREVNPFDSRTLDFRNSAVNTFVSLLVAAGRRYEGDIAFNPEADSVNKVGLIETYETVLRRGRGLSIDSGFNFAPANDALLLAASKISSLYTLLGNEAFFDQQDPTIGFTTADGSVGSLAPSLFAFQNQVDSLLEEELALLRGRDENRGAPVYNRLPPNFTGGEGQIAYRQAYNITDVEPRDGFINEADAARMFPQGHGDSWGHYLTSLTTYYRLLRQTNFVWLPRTEQVLLSGAPIAVDYEDERKFAAAAAAKSRVGAEIAGLTYRQQYTGDPAGQWQGYKDTDTDRAWGVTEWARRTGQGAFFDWVTANALLPAEDLQHVGIQKIDRTTVAELKEIVANHAAVQSQEDSANIGLNPLGLAEGSVPFDIDPTFLDVGSTAQVGAEAVQGLGHFEQIAQRAQKALNNAVNVFNHANQLSQNLRRTQDSAADFAANVADQERDYDNRLIEIFGYPYAGTKGPGRPYAADYNGPDLIFYNYVDPSDLTGDTTPDAAPSVTAFYKSAQAQIAAIPDGTLPRLATMTVEYPLKDRGWRFTAPPTWGSRRAPGTIQSAVSDLLQAQGNLTQELDSYDGLLQDIEARVRLLKAKYAVQEDKIQLLSQRRNTVMGMNAVIGVLRSTRLTLRSVKENTKDLVDDALQNLPTVAGLAFDVSAPIRTVLTTAKMPITTALENGALVAEVAENVVDLSKEAVALETEIQLQVDDNRYEIRQAVAELESFMRNESTQRIGLYTLKEAVVQARGRYLAEVAAGLRVLDERDAFRQRTAARVADARYNDATFRIFRNDAIQKYRAAFDLAARYVYVSATAYDFETTFLGTQTGSGQQFLADIVRQRALGEVIDGVPIAGRHGIADSMARLMQNFNVLKPSLGFNNPQLEQGEFSLRNELFREKNGTTPSDEGWQAALKKHRVDDLWNIPEFRRYCRPFAPAPEQGGPAQPGLVIPFSTTVTFGLNHFGWPLAGGESAYDASRFSTKVRSVGTSFSGYPTNEGGGLALSRTPRIYFIPVGTDILRSAAGDTLQTREFKLVDQKIPVPFPIGNSDLNNPGWIPQNDSLSGTFVDIRRYSSYLATSDTTFDGENTTTDSRLIGRSVWNTRWLLIIPGGTLLNDPDDGLDAFIDSVSDITLYFSTYSFGGN